MNSIVKVAGLSLLLVLGAASHARAQQSAVLPDGPGKATTISLCSSCHEAAKAASVKLTREGWVETIDKMKALGAQGSEAEFQQVLDYLATNFKGDVVQPLDMNTAEALDLESVLTLLRRESAAVLQLRSKLGSFASLDDLKTLDPAIYHKIEARKDRIVFSQMAASSR